MVSTSCLLQYAKEIRNEQDIKLTDDEKKVCILFVNYNSGGFLGQPVINDCGEFAKNLIGFGYKCFFICNSKVSTATEILKKVLSMKDKRIVFFYSGHGTIVYDSNGDEADGRDEAFCFSDRYFVDDEFCRLINEYLKCEKFICISDACHSGTIYDIEHVDKDKQDKITCISSCADNQTSKQLEKNGIFTLNFWRCYNKSTKRLDLSKINNSLDWFNQTVIMYPKNNKFIDF